MASTATNAIARILPSFFRFSASGLAMGKSGSPDAEANLLTPQLNRSIRTSIVPLLFIALPRSSRRPLNPWRRQGPLHHLLPLNHPLCLEPTNAARQLLPYVYPIPPHSYLGRFLPPRPRIAQLRRLGRLPRVRRKMDHSFRWQKPRRVDGALCRGREYLNGQRRRH